MPGRKHKLLVVDDELFNRDMLAQRLVRSGFEVAQAGDAHQALGVIEQGGIDLVLLDTMMPGMSGIDLLKLLRGVHGPSELPVIMATAVTDSESVARALDLGANDYVPKPVDFRVALARIHSQLNRKESEQRLRESEERYALASRGNGDGIWDWDLVTDRVYYSPRWRAIAGLEGAGLGNSSEEWLGRVHPEDREHLRSRLAAHWAADGSGERPFLCEYRMRLEDGSYRWMRCHGHTVRDAGGKAVRMTGTQTDITEQKVYDQLTGLANRLLFLERAGQALDRARENPGFRFAILFLDIDRFKLVNDTMGHVAGDRLLVEVATRLQTAIAPWPGTGPSPDGPTIARFGGDEFAVLLDCVGPDPGSEVAAARLLRALDDPFLVNGREVFASVSIGIAASTPLYASVEDLLRDAEMAMYTAKAKGGASFAVFDEPMRRRAAARLAIETGLHKALERNELALHYQPKVNLETGALAGFEALLRWNHPVLGMVGPADFIPVAEETGRIVAMGEWVIREACRQMVEWQARYPQDPPLAVSVNLSVRQFRQPDIAGVIGRILEETRLPPQCLQLEITESVVMDDQEAAIATTRKLKELGAGIKLDDFGTGYSGLSYLCRMPVDTLKIDRSFIVRMRESKADLEIVRMVLTLARGLARGLGLEVVAEGVERSDQIAQLRALGCEFAQGYYFGRPASAAETARVLAANRAALAGGAPAGEW